MDIFMGNWLIGKRFQTKKSLETLSKSQYHRKINDFLIVKEADLVLSVY